MKKLLSNLISYLFTVFLCVAVLCFTIESVSFDAGYHLDNVDAQAIKSQIPINDYEINKTLKEIVEYIQGKRSEMPRLLPDGGNLFNEREILHMADVRYLFKLCSFLKFTCIGICMILFVVLFTLNGFYCFKILARGCVMTMISMMGLFAIIGIWYMIDFSSLWTAFHKIAFTNDLWLMMPDDALIIFYSLEFFTAIAKRIIERLAIVFGGMFVFAVLGWILLPGKKGKKFVKKNSCY